MGCTKFIIAAFKVSSRINPRGSLPIFNVRITHNVGCIIDKTLFGAGWFNLTPLDRSTTPIP